MEYFNLFDFFRNALVDFAKLGQFLVNPLFDVPGLPAWVTSPLALFSVAGITLVVVMSLISLLNPLS